MGDLMSNNAILKKEKDKIKNGNLMKNLYNIVKRIVDIIVGFLGCIILFPLTIIIWIVNKIQKNSGTIFYKQTRIGKDGKEFKLWKYRSMIQNADNELEKYLNENEQAAQEFIKYRKLKDDPRVIKPLGSFLRKTNLDEFPQFINVLKGEMSLIGPRPYLLEEKNMMSEEDYKKIIKVKPGITGEWQVFGKNRIEFQDRIKMEAQYTQNVNILLDLKIFAKTIIKMLTNTFEQEHKKI